MIMPKLLILMLVQCMNLETYWKVNLLRPGPHFIKKKIIYRATVSQRLRNPALDSCLSERTGPSFILSFETEENYKPGVRIADLKLNTGTPE